MSDGFYRAFEDRYRGSRDLIQSRLRVYLPFIGPLASFNADLQAVDLGCGRGEWLELLRRAGFDGQGVDLDQGMLAACMELGLKVRTGDALGFLRELPAESQVVVSGFHIAEHLSFSDLQELVRDALRVLKPGGMLILETPNPENIVVGTTSFYLDPTHERAIPPQLLSFLPEHYGFERVKVLRVQEVPVVANSGVTLLDVLCGVSPDYAVVAQKAATPEQMKLFDSAFEKNYGLTLEMLALRFEERIARAERAEATWEQIRSSRLWRAMRWLNRRFDGFRK